MKTVEGVKCSDRSPIICGTNSQVFKPQFHFFPAYMNELSCALGATICKLKICSVSCICWEFKKREYSRKPLEQCLIYTKPLIFCFWSWTWKLNGSITNRTVEWNLALKNILVFQQHSDSNEHTQCLHLGFSYPSTNQAQPCLSFWDQMKSGVFRVVWW